MTTKRAMRLAYQWANGHVCSVRDGEAEEYHKMFLDMLCTQEKTEENTPLTLDELREMDAPVWCVCKPIEGGNGYWCLCQSGNITTPAGTQYYVDGIPHWIFLRHKPEEGTE